MGKDIKQKVNRVVICDNAMNFDIMCPYMLENFGYPEDFLENREFGFLLGIYYDKDNCCWTLVEDVDLINEDCIIILLGDEYHDKDIIDKIAQSNDVGLLYHSATLDHIVSAFGEKSIKSYNDNKGLYLPVLQIINKGKGLTLDDINLVLSLYNNW